MIIETGNVPQSNSATAPPSVPTQYVSPQPVTSHPSSPSLPPTVPTTTYSAKSSTVPPNQQGNPINNFINSILPQQKQPQMIPPQQMTSPFGMPPQLNQNFPSQPMNHPQQQQQQQIPLQQRPPQQMNNPVYVTQQPMQRPPMQPMHTMQQMPMQQMPLQQRPYPQQMPMQQMPPQQFMRPPMQMQPQQYIPQQQYISPQQQQQQQQQQQMRMTPMNNGMMVPQQQQNMMNKPMYINSNTIPPNNVLMRPPPQQQQQQPLQQYIPPQRMMPPQQPQSMPQQPIPNLTIQNVPQQPKTTSLPYTKLAPAQPQKLQRSESVHSQKQPLPPIPPKTPPVVPRTLPSIPQASQEDDSMAKSLQEMELQDKANQIQDVPIASPMGSEGHLTLKSNTTSLVVNTKEEEHQLLKTSQSQSHIGNTTIQQYLQSLYGENWKIAAEEGEEPEMEYDQSNQILSMTLKQWIELLTSNEQQQELLSVFLLTWSSFVANRKELISKLLQRFYTLPPKEIQNSMDQLQQFKKDTLDPIRLKVTLFFKYWIKQCYSFEFVNQQTELNEFIQILEKSHYNALVNVLKKSLQEAADEFGQKWKPLKAIDCPASLKPKKSLFKSKEDDIWKHPIQEIARQICLIEFNDLFSKIEPKELCNSAWDKQNRATQAIHILKWSNWFVKLQQWIATCILEVENLQKRAKRVEQCIELALQLIQCNNWNSSVAVVMGLTCKAVARLSSTFGTLSEANRQKIDNLKSLIQKEDNFASLRQAMEHVMLPAIPYLGIYLSPLSYIESHYKTFDSKHRIQVIKCKKLHQVISEVQYYQSKRFQFMEIHELKQALLHVRCVDEETQYSMSIKLESSTNFLTSTSSFLNRSNTSNASNDTDSDSDVEANDSEDALSKALQSCVSKQYILDYEKLVFSTNQFLGAGARGTVYKGTYYLTPVAVKLFVTSRYGITAEVSELADFFNEAKFLCEHSNHPNVVRFIGVAYNKQTSQLALATELCANGDIGTFVERNPVSWEKKLEICFGIASGMAHLHSVHIIHRDLKCDNILLDSNLVPKIIDFGFSKQMATSQQNMTMNVGTAAFCAPEVIQTTTSSSQQQQYDSRCDVYSFAIIMFIIYTDNPFPYGKQMTDIQLLYFMAQNPEHRPTLPENIPPEKQWYIDLMVQCWNTNPEKRPIFETIAKLFLEKMHPQQHES